MGQGGESLQMTVLFVRVPECIYWIHGFTIPSLWDGPSMSSSRFWVTDIRWPQQFTSASRVSYGPDRRKGSKAYIYPIRLTIYCPALQVDGIDVQAGQAIW